MVKRFECPRCGSGVRPDDEQCFRCGEMLREEVRPLSIPDVSMRPEVLGKTTGQLVERPIVHPEKVEMDAKAKAMQRRERELAEKERVINASVEQLENDTRALEEAIKRFEREDHEMREREEILKQRELTMSSLAERVEGALPNVEGEGGAEAQLSQLKELSQDYSKRVSDERRRQKAELDKEIEERLNRLKTIQELVAAAQSVTPSSVVIEAHHPEVFDQPNEMPEEELAAAVASVDEAVRDQLSAAASVPVASLITTGDEKLDNILGGGIPSGHVLIVNGPSGSMKSTLCYHIVHNAAKTGDRRSLYFSLEQKRDSIIRQMERMGMPLAEARDKMLVVDMVDMRKATENDPGDWRSVLMRYVKNLHEQMPF
ncbi:MAG TPA: ATPase domain-containing protein, partial [Methanomassiliicoccales archaeon]|nr:ATPase domain-containing protein [Methanomassiliicoccales archaeon]